VGADRSRRDPQLPGGCLDIQVKEDAQHDHLALPGRQAPQRGQHRGVQAGPRATGHRDVMIG
jgi:hypothetical protein